MKKRKEGNVFVKKNVEKRKVNHRGVWRDIRKNISLYVMFAFPLIYLIVFKYVPMFGIQIAFKDYKIAQGIMGSKWVGLKYFIKFITNYQFKTILLNTVIISLYQLATIPLAIVFALLLNYIPRQRFKKFVQMMTYMPYFISTVVMVGIIIRFLDAQTGVINAIISALGGEAKNWMAYPEYFRHIYVWSGVWKTLGYSAVIYIAALSGVSSELHEAAVVDGATILQRIWHVDLPAIRPTIVIQLILSCGSILSVGYEQIYLMQNSLNLSKSEVISTYVYKQGLASAAPQYSYGTAIGLMVSVINVIFLIIVNKVADKLSDTSLF